jgi:hypothetical protein
MAPVEVPRFRGRAAARAESASGALTNHLTGTLHIAPPVDEWMYGVARVRAQVHA